MFSVPALIVDHDGKFVFEDGLLSKLVPELGGTAKLSMYAKLVKSGWHKIDYGYSAFVQKLPSGEKNIFVGLNPIDVKPTKKLEVPCYFSKADFENYVRSMMEAEMRYEAKAQEDLNMLVHDLRRLSTSIYHSATSARDSIESKDYENALVRIENAIAAQQMLRIRTEVLDFAGNPDLLHEERHVPIYRRVDKVVRSFSPSAERKNIELLLTGNSFARGLGPDVFEIIPYVLIDNALKYSPRESEVKVSVYETSSSVEIVVDSLGPDIEPAERDQIFQRGFRSEAARSREVSGSGIGLYLAKLLVEKFRGTIGVEVCGPLLTSKVGSCRSILFSVSIPICNDSPY